MPLNVREILCNELLLDLKSELQVSCSPHNFPDCWAFLASVLVCFLSTPSFSHRNCSRKKGAFFLYQNWSISKKTFYELAYMTEELLC